MLPRYTVLVPVYHEANVIGELMGNLGALDYPAEKLEILVLLESDDTETIEAARAAQPAGDGAARGRPRRAAEDQAQGVQRRARSSPAASCS